MQLLERLAESLGTARCRLSNRLTLFLYCIFVETQHSMLFLVEILLKFASGQNANDDG